MKINLAAISLAAALQKTHKEECDCQYCTAITKALNGYGIFNL